MTPENNQDISNEQKAKMYKADRARKNAERTADLQRQAEQNSTAGAAALRAGMFERNPLSMTTNTNPTPENPTD